MRRIVSRSAVPLAEEIGSVVGKLEKRLEMLQGTITEQGRRLATLQTRLKAIEKRAILKPPQKPKLVADGGSDGAD